MAWIASVYNTEEESIVLTPLTNDASFRKYYRFTLSGRSLVAVDSPPTREKNQEFIAVQAILFNNKVHVPQVFFNNLEYGYFIIEDFGNSILLSQLKQSTMQAQALYQLCLNELIKIQLIDTKAENNYSYKLPDFDQQIQSYEFELFTEWFIGKYLSLNLTAEQNVWLSKIFSLMADSFADQPKVLVHRDYHSRNLMLVNTDTTQQIGVIDFQDALTGPVTYDLISLFRDCYISWPLETVQSWTQNYFAQAKHHNIIKASIEFDTFWLWFLQTSLQRNFKAIGIFSRLYLRDNKPVYLGDIPRTLNYAIEACYLLANYDNAHAAVYIEAHDFLQNEVKPRVSNLTRTEQLIN